MHLSGVHCTINNMAPYHLGSQEKACHGQLRADICRAETTSYGSEAKLTLLGSRTELTWVGSRADPPRRRSMDDPLWVKNRADHGLQQG